ncbi:MarR family winged helix-turn-helix transcriptional regulator [Streptacidiphilus sp. PAMC 29251]
MSATPDEIPALVIQLVNLSRRFRSNGERLHPELTFAAYSLLAQLQQLGGARAGDLVGLSGLNKSTISRQLADLQREDLVVRALDPADNRVQVIKVSERGLRLLTAADAAMRRETARRTVGWTPQEIAAFHGLLARYNQPPGREDDALSAATDPDASQLHATDADATDPHATASHATQPTDPHATEQGEPS